MAKKIKKVARFWPLYLMLPRHDLPDHQLYPNDGYRGGVQAV
ncbi:MAG: hypothetical protein ACLSHA_07745 [Neglectibacter timonensis]